MKTKIRFNKLTTWLLTLVMLMTLMPMSAFAGSTSDGVSAYTQSTGFYGEAKGEASESVVVELYEGSTKLATATTTTIADNGTYSWSIAFDTVSADENWTVEWEDGYPKYDMNPDTVKLIIDGSATDESDIQYNDSTGENEIVALAEGDSGGVMAYTSLAGAIGNFNGRKVNVLCDVTEAIDGFYGCTLTTNVEDGVTINNTCDNWVYMNDLNIGKGVTLKTAYVFYDTDGVNTIEGTLEVSGTFYHGYNAKTTIQNGGNVIVEGANASTIVRYNTKEDAGLYIYGDGDDETVEFKNSYYIGAYSGTFYAKDANIETGYFLLKPSYDTEVETERVKYPPTNMTLDNSTIKTVGTLDGQGQFTADDNASITLKNGSTINVYTDFSADDTVSVSGDETSSIKDVNGTVDIGVVTYTVTFDANDGTVTPTSAETGTDGKLAELPTPERTGYTFNGWFTAATGGTKVTTDKAYTENTTIYAQWQRDTSVQLPIYIDGTDGNDENDGFTSEQPVKTLKKAIELAGTNGKIIVMKTVWLSSDHTIENITIERYENNTTDNLFSVAGNANDITTITVKNATIDGKGITLDNTINTNEEFFWLGAYASLILEEGAKLVNNRSVAVYVATNAELIMNNGEIAGNISPKGFAVVHVSGTFKMNGGAIKNNRNEYSFGGAVDVYDGIFIMTDGEISGNYAYTGGGGVFGDGATLTVLNGKIINNTVNNDATNRYGGGIYGCYDTTLNIYGGEISGNTCINGDGISFMGNTNTTINVKGSPKISGTIDIGPAHMSSAVQVMDTFTPVNPLIINRWGATVGTVIATYAETLTADASKFKSYSDSYSTKVDGANVILANPAVTFDANGGTVTPAFSETGTDGKLTELPTPTRTGYKFNGWFDAQTGGTEVTTDKEYIANTTIYAQWTEALAFVTTAANITTYYVDLASALDAAKDGDTVTVLAGEHTGDVTVNKAITFVGETDTDGINLATIKGKLSLTGSGIAVKNLNVNNSSERAVHLEGGDILIEDCNLTGVDGLKDCKANNGDVKLKNCAINGGTYGVEFDGGSGDGDVIIDVCTISGWTSFGVDVEEVTISNTTFVDGNYNLLRFYQNATLTNVTIPSGDHMGYQGSGMRIDTGSGGAGMEGVTVTAINCNTTDGSAFAGAFDPDTYDESDIYVDGELLGAIAKIADTNGNIYFKTLAKAIDAAPEEGTVTLLKDNVEEIVISKALTIELNNFTAEKVSPADGYIVDTSDTTMLVFEPVISVTGVTLDKTTASLKVGNTITLTATVEPTNATYKTVTWASDNTSVATVADDGTVTAVAAGTATITATAGDKTATCTVTVTRASTGGGSGSSSTSTTTTKNDDGSTTKTTTNKATGTTTETTTYPDGSTTKVETEKDGTVTTTEKDAEGNKTVTTENPDGTTTTEETKKDGTTVKTETDADGETTVTVEAKGETEVVIPVENAEEVYEVVITDAEGKETVITDFETVDKGIAITVDGNVSVVMVKGSKKEFVDVHPVDHWSEESVDYVYLRGLMKGTSETHFSPDVPLTRAMLVTILHRLEGEPEIANDESFADVASGSYYEKAVAWAKEKGIVKGISETAFAPETNITREQMAAIMHRYAVFKGYDDSVGGNTNILSYSDFDAISEYAIASMQYAVGSGLMKGKTDTTLNPLDNATRAETAAILHRFIEAN